MNEIKKAVVLCSGGFDSVILTHYVKNELEYEHGYCLFFNYHQKSYEVEKKWAEEHCNRVGYKFVEVALPKFTWTNGGFYDEYFEDTKHQYLESRNKVFLAFATSLAEAKKCEKIFIGAIGGEGEEYNDCTPKYFNAETKAIQESTGLPISICAPFCNTLKADLVGFARKYDILPNEWSSCDYVIDGKIPCGECKDCESSSEVAELLLGTYINHQKTYDVTELSDKDIFAEKIFEVVEDSYRGLYPINKVVLKCTPDTIHEVAYLKELLDNSNYKIELIVNLQTLNDDWVADNFELLMRFEEIHLPFGLKGSKSEIDSLEKMVVIKYYIHSDSAKDAVEKIEQAEKSGVEDLIIYFKPSNSFLVGVALLAINEELLRYNNMRVQVVLPRKAMGMSNSKLVNLFHEMLNLYNYPFPVAFEKTADNCWSSYLSVVDDEYRSV